jgi:hypothetical protein
MLEVASRRHTSPIGPCARSLIRHEPAVRKGHVMLGRKRLGGGPRGGEEGIGLGRMTVSGGVEGQRVAMDMERSEE